MLSDINMGFLYFSFDKPHLQMSFGEAFTKKVSQLCLDCFPSGVGPWRHDAQLVSTLSPKQLKGLKNLESHFSVTLKDHDASLEKTETLKEYVSQKRSPWLMDYDWSTEAQSLRELSIETPWKVTPKLIQNHFRSIRLTDENITYLDDSLSHLTNLQSLTLSANYLTEVPSQSLPRGLKSVELYGNQLEDLVSLVDPIPPPPGMEHLGVGANQISALNAQISAVYWPALISLDLSRNHLDNICDVVSQLSSLPKLRYLQLVGNPLALLPHYRGYVIDALKKLIILDDIRISADERHGFRGMAKRIDRFNEQIHITFKVSHLVNVPNPEEAANGAEVPDFPVVNRKYFLCFWVVSEKHEETTDDEMQIVTSEPPPPAALQGAPADPKSSHDNMAHAVASSHQTILINPLPRFREVDEDGIPREGLPSSSVPYMPGEGLPLEWTHTIISQQLRDWRDFLQSGIHFDLVEEKTLLYPPDELPVEHPSNGSCPSAGKGGKKGGKGKQADEGAANAAANDGEKKKKKKVDESQLVAYSREWRVLGHFHENGAQALVTAGERVCKSTTKTELIRPQLHVTSATKPPAAGAKGKGKDQGGKDKKGAPTAPKGGGNSKPGKKGAAVQEDKDADDAPPAEITLGADVEFHILQWRHTRESFSPEELKGAAARLPQMMIA